MTIKGKVKKVYNEETFGSGFRKKDIVVTTQEKYPQDIIVEFVQDKVDSLEGINVGDNIEVSFNIRGREWESPDGKIKYFNTIQGWKVESVDSGGSSDEEIPPLADFDDASSGDAPSDDGGELPF